MCEGGAMINEGCLLLLHVINLRFANVARVLT